MALAHDEPLLRVGIVLVPDFTMLAFAGLADTLRLAADERDRSRPILRRWHVMTVDGRPVRSSGGIVVEPTSALVDPERFDYVVVVGGTMHGSGDASPLYPYLAAAAARRVPLVGVCTGSFHLARAGLMAGRRACVTWLHHAEFQAEFPDVEVVADELFVVERDRITCAGGTGVIHLASYLVERHLGRGSAAKGLRLMLEEGPREGRSPQPPPVVAELAGVKDDRVRRAVLLVEQSLAAPLSGREIAARTGVSHRHLARLLREEIGCSIGQLRQRMRIERARAMMAERRVSLTAVAAACGFADAAHFSRAFKTGSGMAPRDFRARNAAC